MKINILTCNMPRKRGKNDFFPLLKWRREFKKTGVSFSFFSNHFDKKLLSCEILIIDFRYFEQIFKGNYAPSGFHSQDTDYIKELLDEASKKNIKTVRFDSGDGAFLFFADLIPFFDTVVKKQVLKNTKDYFSAETQIKAMNWRPMDQRNRTFETLGGLNEKDQQKLKVGWNIGMSDYRSFPNLIHKYSPIGTQRLFPETFKEVAFRTPNVNRKFHLTYRGGLNGRDDYDQHRKRFINEINKIPKADDIRIGGKVSKKRYEYELKNSKVGLSPFGWGEVCYRDFETIINGSLLVKPCMDHLKTYPNVYHEMETYVPFKWDSSDLRDTLVKISRNYKDYIPIIEKAQKVYHEYYYSANLFVQHFKENVIND